MNIINLNNDNKLLQNLKEAMKVAMRQQQKLELTTIRMVLADIKRFEIDEKRVASEPVIIGILDKLAKQRRDSINQFQQANRPDLVEKEEKELKVIESFLPEALSVDELNQLISDSIKSTGANTIKQMGQVMDYLRPKIIGRADIAEVSKIVRQKLQS